MGLIVYRRHKPNMFDSNSILYYMPPVAERLRRAYPALPERASVGSIPANSDAQNVPSFRRWRLERKLSPFIIRKEINVLVGNIFHRIQTNVINI